MWFTCVTIGTIATVVVIFSLWEKFQTNPTITGLDTDFHNWDVPFPALTVCQKEPTSRKKISEYIEEQFNRAAEQDEIEFYFSLSQLSYSNWIEFTKNYSKQTFISNNTNLKEVIYNITYSCEELFSECVWKASPYNCCEGFFAAFTDNGFCFVFNGRNYERKSPGTKISMPKFKRKYIQETDLRWAMAFRVRILDSLIPIYIMNSDEIASYDVQPQHIWDFRVGTMMFSVKETFTTEDTAQLSIKQRRCVFNNEIPLQNTVYSYTACLRHCRMNTAMKLCSCIPHFYPAHKGFVHCTMDQMVCISKHLDAIKSVDWCSCYLGCSHTAYAVEKLDAVGNDNLNATGIMNCEFVSWPMVRYKREVLFGWVDLLVSFGGIAGLFLGFSLLSGVEIIYFFTVRAVCMVLMEKDELRRIEKEDRLKPQPEHDLSLVPYFISRPLPGHGIDEVAKNFKNKYTPYQYNDRNQTKGFRHNLRRPEDIIIPPFGIEYVN